MNEIQTRDKGLLLCKNLLDKGILTQSDYEQCLQIYQPSTGLSKAVAGVVQGIPEAKTSAEISFGMTKKQGTDELGYDVAKKPSYTAFFKLVNSKSFYRQTNRKGISHANSSFSEPDVTNDSSDPGSDPTLDPDNTSSIYMTLKLDTGILYLTEIDTNTADAATNAVFNVELRQDGNYTIQNDITKYYIRVGTDPETKEPVVLSDNSELVADCLFKQTPLTGNQYEFESVAKKGYYLSALHDNGLIVGLSTMREGRVWELEFLGGGEMGPGDIDSSMSTDIYDTSEAKTIIYNVLRDVKAARSKYYLLEAQLDFLNGLREQIVNMVSENGPLMKYYNNLAAARTPGMTTDLLDSLSYSMRTEITGRELYAIDQELNKLNLDATKIRQAEMQDGSTKILRVRQIITSLIDERRKQIAGLTKLLDKITIRQNSLSSHEDITTQEMNYYDTTGQIISINSNISQSRGTHNRQEYWGLIGFIVLITLFAIFMSYKLWTRWQIVFAK